VNRATKRKPHKVHRAVRRKPPVPVSIIRVPNPVEKPWELSEEQVTILKNSICKGANDDEMKYCLTVSRRYKLDPFKGQIWFIRRWDKEADNGNGGKGRYVWTPQVGIYGMAHIAARDHKDYGTISLPEFGPSITITVDGKQITGPEWARVKLWKKGVAEPTEAEAYFEEYCPQKYENTLFWRKMPRRQLSKCAKAQGIREAYPDLGGLYIPEECERIQEDFTESGREVVAHATSSSGDASEYERLKNRTPEQLREEAKAFLGTNVQGPKEPRGVIELDWTDEASPVVRGDIAEQLETMKLNMHMTWGSDNWWHCEPRDAEALRVICAQFGYELKQILPDKFPVEGASPDAPAASKQKPGKTAAGGLRAGVASPASGSKVEPPSTTPAGSVQKLPETRSAPERTKVPEKNETRPKPLPRAQIPFVVKAVQKTPSGKGLEVTVDTGAKFYAFDNRKMGEDGEKLLDLLLGAVGKECIFVTSKNQTKDKREFMNIVTALRIGDREWGEDGVPILRREPAIREPGED
jgi:hypothetical protein